jgi:tetratricopeptide (TPR) repeat protein
LATFGEALGYARRLLAAGDLPKAEVIYRQLVEAFPQAAEPWHELGILHLRADRAKASVEYLRQAAMLEPNVPTYHSSLAVAYHTVKQYAEAITCLEHALKLAPPTAELLNNLALALKDAGQTDAALRAFDDALRIRPQYATGHFNRARLLARTHRLEEAAKSYQQAIDLQPQDPAANCLLGLCLLRNEPINSVSIQQCRTGHYVRCRPGQAGTTGTSHSLLSACAGV